MTTPSKQPSAYDPFRPVAGAWVARIVAVATLVVFTLVAIFSPSYDPDATVLNLLNRAGIFLLGVLGAAFLWRYTLIKAVPSPQGLKVQNIIRTHDVEWAQILSVGYSGGAPWAVLELTDTQELAVMAIQRADGDRARREASRLAALIEHHQRGVEEPGR